MAGYRWLAEREEMILDRRAHPSALLAPGLQTVALIGVLSLLGFVYDPGDSGDVVDRAAGVGAVVAVGRCGYRALRWWSTHLVLTDRRIVSLSGVLGRRISSLSLARVFDVGYRRSPAGRILGYGTVTVESAAGPMTAFERVPDVAGFCGTVMGLLMSDSSGRPPPGGVLGLGSAAEDEDTGPLPRVIV